MNYYHFYSISKTQCYFCLKMQLIYKRHRKAHVHKHIDRQTSKWLEIFLHHFSKIDSCHLKFHKFFFILSIITLSIQFQRPSVTSGPPCIIMYYMSNTIWAQHIDKQTSIYLVIFPHNFSKIDSCHLKFH